MKETIHLDLFSGIGGFALAMDMAGIKPTHRYNSDVCTHGNAVYGKNFSDAVAVGDITKLDANKLKEKHGEGSWIVTGGFPCQDLSTAGHMQGIDGARSGLWSQMFRTVRILRPAFMLAENVAALSYQGLDHVLRDLSSIGFDAEWQVVPASQIGASHIRKRIWIVGYPSDTSEALRRSVLQETSNNGYLGTLQQSDATTAGILLRSDWAKEMAGIKDNAESYILRKDDGLPDWLDAKARVASLGNAIVPQVAAMILERCKIFID